MVATHGVICVTICKQHTYIIGMEHTKCQYSEEAYGAVAADEFLSLPPYNELTNAYYSGLINNILPFQLVTMNTDSTPEFLAVALLMHMSTYHNQHM